MLRLTPAQLESIQAHAKQEYPRECCGIFVGTSSQEDWHVRDCLKAANLAPEARHDRYLMDPKSRLRAEAVAKDSALAVVGFYHSHPDHDAYFSQTDLESSEEFLMGEPWLPPSYAYFVLSVRKGDPGPYKAFVVRDGKAQEIPVVIGDD